MWQNKFAASINNEIIYKAYDVVLNQDYSSHIKQSKSSDINVLLNRIELNKKNESRKKLYFSAAASAGLVLFGFIIF